MGEVLTNGVYLPDRGERNAYDGLKGNWNTLDSIAGKVPGYDAHISDTDIHVTAADKQTWNGKADASHVHNADDVTTGVFDAARIPNLDASKITTGTIDIDRLPQGALERLVKVADQAARYALTASDVQLGDTVQQLDTGVMYVVTDETKLDSADGYTEYTAGSATSVPWSGVTGKPADYTPASHSHGNITNDGKVGTAANKPLITGTDGVVQAGVFGNQANTFCEGNDSRLSDARTPVAHTHTKSDVTDLFNSANTWTKNNTFSADCIVYNSDSGGLTAGLKLRNSKAEVLSTGNTSADQSMTFRDKNDVAIGYIKGAVQSNSVTIKIGAYAKDSSNNTVNTELQLLAYSNGNKAIIPSTTNAYDLGTSSYKWKTLNGVNPGALSLPDMGTTADVNYFDFISAITHLDGTDNFYTPTVDGWMTVIIAGTALSLFEDASSGNNHEQGSGISAAPVAGYCLATIPVHKTKRVKIQAVGTSVYMAQVRPCLGNV